MPSLWGLVLTLIRLNMMKNKFLNKYSVWLVFALSASLSIFALLHYYHLHEILAYNDARSRLDIARRVTDSRTPGIVQLGTIWLPLQQFLTFPLVINYKLWQTGLGGSIVSMISYVLTSVYLFKTVLLLTKKTWLGIFAALVFMLNINILYMQTTTMTELVLYSTMTAGFYYFIKWFLEKKDIDLVLAAFSICLATLARYEGWLMLLVCGGIVFYENRYHLKDKKKAEGQTILFLTLGGFGIFLWLLWNLLFFANPFYFLFGEQGQYSLSGHASANRHHILTTLNTIWRTVGYNIGPITLALAITGIVFILLQRRNKKRYDVYLLLLLLSPIIVNIATLFSGTTVIDATSLTQAFDVRYGLVSVIIVAIVFAVAIDKITSKYIRTVLAAVILSLLLVIQPSSYLGAVNGGRSLSVQRRNLVSFMTNQYKNGDILASTYAYDPIMHAMGFPLKNYIYEGNGIIWKNALTRPEMYVKYVMMSTNVPHDPVYDAYNNQPALYNKYYISIYSKNGDQVLQLKSSLTKTRSLPSDYTKEGSRANTDMPTAPKVMTITVKTDDSQTSMTIAVLKLIDNTHSLNSIQAAYVVGNTVAELGNRNFIYPGETVTFNLVSLDQLINQSKKLNQTELSAWQPYSLNLY